LVGNPDFIFNNIVSTGNGSTDVAMIKVYDYKLSEYEIIQKSNDYNSQVYINEDFRYLPCD